MLDHSIQPRVVPELSPEAQQLRAELPLESTNAFRKLEQQRDCASWVLEFVRTDLVVGTARLLPFGHRLSPVEEFLRNLGLGEHLNSTNCEIGRLVVAVQHRGDATTLKTCLYLAVRFLVERTEVRNCWAVCVPILTRVYKRYGSTVVVKQVVPGFDLITGDPEQMMVVLSRKTN